jgi:hypothetical protein
MAGRRFADGTVLEVKRLLTKRGRAAGWTASLDEPGRMLRSARSNTRERAAEEVVRMWLQWTGQIGAVAVRLRVRGGCLTRANAWLTSSP